MKHQIVGSEVGRSHAPGLLSIRAYPAARRSLFGRVLIALVQLAVLAFAACAFLAWAGWYAR